jgi:phosphohistidine phosphatase
MTDAMPAARRAAPRRALTLYLVRHAIAAPRGNDWPDDAKRPLTHKGRARMREIARGLARLGAEPDLVLTSPLLRAHETAEILVGDLRPPPKLQTAPALAPGHPQEVVAQLLENLPRAAVVALVGHEPGMGELAAWLLGTREPPTFKKGGVCCVETPRPVRAGSAQLIWFATPRMLRAVARARR